MAAAPHQLPELVDDLVAEILLRFPPDDPACLFRAALVCKPWHHVLSSPGFRRRYREFHRTPPLLGVFHDEPISHGTGHGTRFVSAAAASPLHRPAFDYRSWRTRDCRHGRVLLVDGSWAWRVSLLVWNPTTGDRQVLHAPDTCWFTFFSSMAVLCAAGNCDHLNCHGGPFQVVFMGANYAGHVMEACVYSSETGAWSPPTSVDLGRDSFTVMDQSTLVGEELYFINSRVIIRYDLGKHSLSAIDLPVKYDTNVALMHAEGGGLGLAGLKDRKLYLWSREGVDGWIQHRVINLDTMLRFCHPMYQPNLMGFAEGANTIFVSTGVANYAIDLGSMQVAVVCMGYSLNRVFPYMSFCMPGELPSLVRSR